ncbi:hypothetical protein ABEF93_008591 [Exophiala dermatitidis]
MAASEATLSAELKALVKQHEAYKIKAAEEQQLVEKLLGLLQQKEQSLENLKSDLDDQTESRRRWQKRATDAESRTTSVQHLLVLVDGNQHFFQPGLIRAGTPGAKEAVDTLLAEVKEFARQQHKNDLPETISVVVHIFSDIGRLAQDLATANLLPDPDRLWTFVQDACKIEPCITISDCGAAHDAVDAKMKQFYELYIENCHCRHIFLALGEESEYYNILQLYSEDDYTKAKTSLVEPAQGFPAGINVPFHIVSLSTLVSVPRKEAFSGEITANINGRSSAPQWEDKVEHEVAVPATSEVKSVQTGSPTTARHEPRVPSSSSDTRRSKGPEENGLDPSPEQWKDITPARNEPNGIIADDAARESSFAGVVKLEPSTHSSSNSNKTAEQSWETTPSANTYVPPPFEGAWGDEEAGVDGVPGRQEHPKHNGTWTSDPAGSYRGFNKNKQAQKPAWRQERPAGFPARRPRRVPQQFEGSWDDMTQGDEPQSQPSIQESSQSLASASVPASAPNAVSNPNLKSNGFKPLAPGHEGLTKPEPYPNARPIWSPIALNYLDQRIDLKLPRPSPGDQELFDLRSRNRRLCNEHHLRLSCNNTSCPYDHEPISDGVYLALRHKARTLPCSIGPGCRRHDCFGSHHCLNVVSTTGCRRPRCPFQARMHDTTDLVIVNMIEPPPKEVN